MITVFSQQDPRWASYKYTNGYTIGRWGCLVTVLSMARNWFYNKQDNPVWTASHLKYTAEGYLLWGSLPDAGLKLIWRYYTRNEQAINEALAAPDKCVALQVNSNHWVWAIGRKLPLLGYKIVDPWDGRIKYTNFYRDNITGSATFSKS